MFNQQTRELALERFHNKYNNKDLPLACEYIQGTKTLPGVHPACLHTSKCALAVSLLKFPNRLTVCFGDLRLSKSVRVVSYLIETIFFDILGVVWSASSSAASTSSEAIMPAKCSVGYPRPPLTA